MEKEFIPYEQSLALKELGFDEPCLAVHYPNKFYLYSKRRGIKNSNKISQSWVCTAPTYSQAFRWFREKYSLRIRNYVFVNMSGGISEGFEVFRYAEDTISRVEALTYEEAELACLIKLIEIVKNK